MTLLIVYLVIAIGVSFLCSVLEAVLLSVTPGYVAAEAEHHPRRSRMLQNVTRDLDRSISSILILNTFAHTMGAAGVGAQAVKIYGEKWEGLIAFALTLAILYLSEIIPKTLGATFWKQLALPASFIIAGLVKLLFPFVWLSALITRLFSSTDRSAISRDELMAMTRLGERHGALRNQESELLQNIFGLRGTRTEDILTPRTVVAALAADNTVAQGLEQLGDRPFTRIPVFRTDIDDVTGIVFRSALLEAMREGREGQPLSDIAMPVFRVSEELPVLQLLDLFIKRREHLFLVEDSYGQTAGVVTLEDAIETLLGREIMDESDKVADMQQLARSAYRERLRSQSDE